LAVAPPTWQIVLVGVLFLIVLLVGYYALTRLRARRKRLALELDNARELVEDRAYNQIRLARAEADVLTRRGTDVTRPSALLDDAEAAQKRQDFDHALGLARSAHEALVRLQAQAPLAGSAFSSGLPATSVAAARLSASSRVGTSSTVAAPAGNPGDPPESPYEAGDEEETRVQLPKNKAESHFQLNLLHDELAKATAEHGPDASVTESTALQDKAQSAFDHGDFTEALRLGLKARRRLGARLETLGPSPSMGPPAPPGESPEGGPSRVDGASELLTCGSCGEPLRPTDRFCRSCGTLRGPARCPACGAAIDSGDRFCAACGHVLTAAATG
jgi:Double zinc ribbon